MRLCIIFLALATVVPGQAKIGDSEDQAIARLGPPNLKSFTGGGGFSLQWKKGDLNIDYFFPKGVVISERFEKIHKPVSLDEARNLVADEMKTSSWTEGDFKSQVAWKSKNDQRGALYTGGHSARLYIVNSFWFVEANVSATQEEWDRVMDRSAPSASDQEIKGAFFNYNCGFDHPSQT